MPAPQDAHNILMQKRAAIKSAFTRLPKIVGNEGKNFFLDRFKQQAWLGNRIEPWPKRKANKWGKKGRNRKDRALLIMTGRLRRSIRFSANSDVIRFYSDVPYARAHNEGFRGTVTQRVGEFKRVQTMGGIAGKFGKGRQFTTGAVSNLRTRKERVVKVKTEVTVKAHTRKIKQHIPKRQFMGPSPYLTKKLQRAITAEIMRAVKS